MQVFSGNEGVVSVAGNAVSRVTDFSITETATTYRTDGMGDQYQSEEANKLSWSGSVNARLVNGDAGQDGFVVGAKVAMILYPDGNATGRLQLSGEATITERTTTANQDDANSVSFSFINAGALTRDNVV